MEKVKRTGAAELIKRDLEILGINLSDDTIREKLSEAGEKIGINRNRDM